MAYVRSNVAARTVITGVITKRAAANWDNEHPRAGIGRHVYIRNDELCSFRVAECSVRRAIVSRDALSTHKRATRAPCLHTGRARKWAVLVLWAAQVSSFGLPLVDEVRQKTGCGVFAKKSIYVYILYIHTVHI